MAMAAQAKVLSGNKLEHNAPPAPSGPDALDSQLSMGHSCDSPFGPPELLLARHKQLLRSRSNGQPLETSQVAQRETRETGKHEICPHCGASIPSSRMSLREMAVSFLCGSLLLSILISAFIIAKPWLEDAGQRFVNRMFWHEPLDSWNL